MSKTPKLHVHENPKEKIPKPVPPEEIVLVCGCGCRTWYMHLTPAPEARCADCGRPPHPDNDQAQWYENLPPPPPDPPGPVPDNKSSQIKQFNTVEQTINHILNQIERRRKSLCAAMIIYEDGHISCYAKDTLRPNHKETDPYIRQWYLDRIENAKRIIMQDERDQ